MMERGTTIPEYLVARMRGREVAKIERPKRRRRQRLDIRGELRAEREEEEQDAQDLMDILFLDDEVAEHA